MTDGKRNTHGRRKRGTQESGTGMPALLRSTFGALLITALVGLGLLLGAAALLLRTKDPDRYHAAAGLIVLYLTAFLGGLLATRMNRRRAPVFCGLSQALLLLLLITLPMFFLPDGWRHAYTGAQTIGFRALLFPASLAGALLAAAKKPRSSRKHR